MYIFPYIFNHFIEHKTHMQKHKKPAYRSINGTLAEFFLKNLSCFMKKNNDFFAIL